MIPAIILMLAAGLFSFAAQPTALEIAHAIRDTGLDAEECYRVRDLNFAKEDLRLYFNDGYLLFGKTAFDKRIWAVYSGDVEGGDAEVIVMPPHRSERRSLASFANTPNLNEHFRSAFFVMTDGSAETLLEQAREIGRRSPEQGILLAGTYAEVARSLSESFAMRLIQDIVNNQKPDAGIFFGTLSSIEKGNIDIIYDPASREQVVVGQVANTGGRAVFDVWCSFEARSVRNGAKPRPEPVTADDYRIDATIDPSLRMSAVTRAAIQVNGGQAMRALPFLISSYMHVTAARIDGRPVEVFSRESLRETAIRGGRDELFLLLPPEPIAPGTTHQVEIEHAGDVIAHAGNNVFFVGARGTWYPHQRSEFAKFDMSFRYPKALTLVGTGTMAEDKTEGDVRMTRYSTNVPIRFAGFNLGEYRKAMISKSGYTIEVYGNRSVEPNLTRRTTLPALPNPLRTGRHAGEALDGPLALAPPPDPSFNLRDLAERVDGAIAFMTAQFGPMPLKTLTVSPIPGFFGQGFPGLVYLSTYAYLSPEERVNKDRSQQTFFTDVLPAHEVAHQWWGNLVTADGYQDEWLMEALANYSALMYLEKRKGAKAFDQVLDEFRTHLLGKDKKGDTVESTGPITWGARLQSSGEENWRVITYEKGAWIIHMLRRQMGDERFGKMLAEMARRYSLKSITTEQFRHLAAQFLPPKSVDPSLDNFFETWVYGTGIPTLKFQYTVRGKAPSVRVSGTVAQSGVADDFSADVPIEISSGKGAPVVRWVRTSDEPVPFNVVVKQAPAKAVLAADAVLATKH